MDTTLALVLVLAPFIGFLLNVFFGKAMGKTLSGTIGTLSVVVSFLVTLVFFMQLTQTNKPIVISLFDGFKLAIFKLILDFY